MNFDIFEAKIKTFALKGHWLFPSFNFDAYRIQWDPKSKHVRYSNGENVFGYGMVQNSSHDLNTEQVLGNGLSEIRSLLSWVICLVFR